MGIPGRDVLDQVTWGRLTLSVAVSSKGSADKKMKRKTASCLLASLPGNPSLRCIPSLMLEPTSSGS